MAEIVMKELVENGHERILQRLYDGVTSNLTLDVSDYKESDEHKLLHLVWRKYPRKRSLAYGQKPITSNSNQTTEMMNISSSAQTALDPNVSLFSTPPANSTIPNVNCLPAVEKGLLQQSELDYSDKSGSFKGSRSKGQRRKIWYPKSQATPLKLTNRFDCFVNAECPENFHTKSLEYAESPVEFHTKSGFSDREMIGSSRKGRYRGSSNTLKSTIQSPLSQNSSKSDLSDNGSVERSSNSSEHIKNIGIVKSFNYNVHPAWGTITMAGVPEDIYFQSKVMRTAGEPVYFDLEYITGKPIATMVTHYGDYDESSTGHQSDTCD